ncbi:glycosyltransferase [Novosphingobium humi]|uniref:Glycosyltransferase n=1 Tax=Novosphingobium humi TaxID=2282397 RepID=A0ABY7TXN7_9SPHN|nr:glycosyltransferase [Novosphingobium humi]WCT77367.1 glycosyltransferase [Novosphingobium humi]
MAFELGDLLCFWPFARGRARPWVRAGNASRDKGDWACAAANYRRATQIEPGRRAIWVQLGHMEKEAGAVPQALEAYRQASYLPANDGDAPFHLGLLARALGDMETARTAFDQALLENHLHQDAGRERLALAHLPSALSANARERAAMLCGQEQDRMNAHGAASTILFDVSDLITYFRHARLPTGIQRVQIEIITEALKNQPYAQICTFIDGAGYWAAIPPELFQSLSSMAVTSGDSLDPEWLNLIETLTAVLTTALQPRFTKSMWFVNLGTSWQYRNYFLHLRDLQRRFAIRYVPFVHDLIPFMAPQFCVDEVVRDFHNWISGVFNHAFAFLTNSYSTQADLVKVAAHYGHRLNENRIAVIALDADFRHHNSLKLSSSKLARWDLSPERYALFVSTIEVRKNHLLALEGWKELIRCYGVKAVPDLVCVGRKGWLSDEVFRIIHDNPELASKVKILSDISDDILSLLYHNCCFTIYPSHYEGWGLPVTESLCYGKVPVVSRCSSLPEAGGDFALYIEPSDVSDFFSAVESLWFDEEIRKSLEQRIVKQFKPRNWKDIAEEVSQALLKFEHALPKAVTAYCPSIRPGTLYRLARLQTTPPVPHAADGEGLRFGKAWEDPDDEGCPIKPEGAEVMAIVEAGESALWLCLRLEGTTDHGLEGQIVMNGQSKSFALKAREKRWFALPIEPGQLYFSIKDTANSAICSLRLSYLMVVEALPQNAADLGHRLINAEP